MTEEPIVPPPFVLSDEQLVAHDDIVVYMTAKEVKGYLLLKGYAGTGKTSTLSRAIKTALKNFRETKELQAFRPTIVASAPTHKAVRVLRKSAELGGNVEYGTIHSLLGLKPVVDDKTGKQVFKPTSDPSEKSLENYSVLVLDEVSMLNREIFDLLIERAELNNIRIIFVGDPVQIPPVGELDSEVLMHPEKYGIKVYELTKSMRQAGTNPILDLASEIRRIYRTGKAYGRIFERVVDGTGITMFGGGNPDIVPTLEKYFCSADFKADADYMKVIAWTNNTVNNVNNRVRNMLYEVPEGMVGLPKLMNGEKLIMDNIYNLPEELGRRLPNNEEIEVVNYEVVRRGIQWKKMDHINSMVRQEVYNPECYKATVSYFSERGKVVKSVIYVLHEREELAFQNILDTIMSSAKTVPFGNQDRNMLFRHYYETKGKFAEVKYHYAVTAHKSQGSTYDNCMVMEWDIHKNFKTEERNRIQYVAVTRARRNLFIID